MIKFNLLFLLLFYSVFVSANSDENLHSLKSMMPKVCHFSGEFIQTKQIKTLPIPLVSNGVFVYSCELGLIWQTQKPIIESLVFTNEELHFLVPEKRSIENLDGVQHNFLANLLLGLMAGNTDFIENEFEILRIENEQNTLTLSPKNNMVKRAILTVVLNKKTEINELEISITDKNKQTTKIVSTEKQQFVSNDDFSKNCHSISTKSCELLLNPVRISASGKN